MGNPAIGKMVKASVIWNSIISGKKIHTKQLSIKTKWKR